MVCHETTQFYRIQTTHLNIHVVLTLSVSESCRCELVMGLNQREGVVFRQTAWKTNWFCSFIQIGHHFLFLELEFHHSIVLLLFCSIFHNSSTKMRKRSDVRFLCPESHHCDSTSSYYFASEGKHLPLCIMYHCVLTTSRVKRRYFHLTV